jgi:ubiquitin thioesterase ZRANB1
LPPSPQATQEETGNKESDIFESKWSCSTCTYLNWPKSLKCVQCYSTKPTSTSTDSSADPQLVASLDPNPKPQLQLCKNSPLNRSLSNSPCTVPKVDTANVKQCVASETGESVPNLPNLPNAANTVSNTNTAGEVTTTLSKKWPCSVCTYQNWPKSHRCVICHVPRYNNSSSNNSNVNTNLSNNNNNNQVI